MKYAYAVMLLIALVTLFFVTQIGQVKTEVDPKQILPQKHPYIETNAKIESLFGGGRVIVMGIVAKEGNIFTPALLTKIERLTRAIKNIPGIYSDNVLSIASRKVKNLRFNAQGFDVERLMPSVPGTQAEADEIKKRVFANPLYVGALISFDASAAAVIIDVQDQEAVEQSVVISGESLNEPLGDLALYNALKRLAKQEEDAQTSIHLGGLPVSLAFLEQDAI